MNKTFANNLKRFRVAQNYTQEQVADILGVTSQTVSRWECNTTLPDVMLLPEIARLYCVTVDDLYKESCTAYENYAQRLFSVYEASRTPEDFVRADIEFKKLLKNGEFSAEDLRYYGIMHQYMMNYCKKLALEMFDKVLTLGVVGNEDTYWRTKHQRMLLISQIGKSQDNIKLQLQVIENNSKEPEEWVCLIAAYSYAGEFENAYTWFRKAIEKFPHKAAFYVYGGDICKNLKKMDEAFQCWDKALELDASFCDAKYSKGFCYEELGEWEKAYDIWCEIAEENRKKGFMIEMEYPLELARKCKEKM